MFDKIIFIKISIIAFLLGIFLMPHVAQAQSKIQVKAPKLFAYDCSKSSSCGKADSDCDGLLDKIEMKLGTDIAKADTDRDGVKDGCEDFNHNGIFEPRLNETNPLAYDSDSDRLNDLSELIIKTNPLAWDTDGDGLGDGVEVKIGTNPLSRDTDKDGTIDGRDPCPNDYFDKCDTVAIWEYIDDVVVEVVEVDVNYIVDDDGDYVVVDDDDDDVVPEPEEVVVDSDGDGIADANDVCPTDPTNSCVMVENEVVESTE